MPVLAPLNTESKRFGVPPAPTNSANPSGVLPVATTLPRAVVPFLTFPAPKTVSKFTLKELETELTGIIETLAE